MIFNLIKYVEHIRIQVQIQSWLRFLINRQNVIRIESTQLTEDRNILKVKSA